ncbi:hypothetical protein P0D73_46135 [Paraburkholderia sp. RL18-101-BIB-B]|uniref:hypothetical protein n=1 Tax=Paraburkholderia sp. RL18-101-BIB-B TaxID=3031634 RepID=UPI0038BE0CF4
MWSTKINPADVPRPNKYVKNFKPMNKAQKIEATKLAIAECVFKKEQRHFLDFNFHNCTPFAQEFTELMCIMEELCPRSGLDFVKRIGSLQGESRSTYEQIVQALCELVIAKKFLDSYPVEQGFKLHWEPTENTKANPEFMIEGKDWRLLVEVKCPSLHDYDTKNQAAAYQVTARLPGVREIMMSVGGEEPALPLDNKVKDFLVSAEKKFSSFSDGVVPTYGLLVICWGERMFEAVTPLSNEACGLLKEPSYFEKNGAKVRFLRVSGVVVTQHQHFAQQMLAGHTPDHQKSCLHFGQYWEFNTPPNPVFLSNTYATRPLPKEFKDVLQTVNAGESLDPIANIMESVMWLHRPGMDQGME